ncbi:hypothetical protein [Hydrogenimonas sp.]
MALDYIDWENRIVYINASVDVPTFKKEIMDAEASSDGIVYPVVIKTGGNDGLYAMSITFINGYKLGFTVDGVLESTNGNLICELVPRAGTFFVIRNAVGFASSGDSVVDTTAPTWESTVGVIDAYQNGDAINARWGVANDPSGLVYYNVYVSKSLSTLWENLLETVDGHIVSITSDGYEPLQTGVYYIGVRAVDRYGNEEENMNSVQVAFDAAQKMTEESIADAVWAKVLP